MKKKLILIIVVLIIIFSWVNSFALKWEEINRPLQERAIEKLSYDTFKVFEFEKGCICFSHGTEGIDKGILFLTYLENDLTSTGCLAIRGNIGERYGHFLNNSNLTRCFVFNLDVFSDNTIYYSCCEPELAQTIIVNGEDVDLIDVEIEWNGEVYKRTFWFYMAKKDEFPKVEFASKTGDDSLS